MKMYYIKLTNVRFIVPIESIGTGRNNVYKKISNKLNQDDLLNQFGEILLHE